MNFKEATDRLKTLGVTQDEIAGALGVSPATVRAARLDPEGGSKASYRQPPEGWAPALIRLARERGGELSAVADELERGQR